MPIKTILVYLPSVKSTQNIMATVAKIAGSRNAHVIGLHISQLIPRYAELSAELPLDVFDQLKEAGNKNADEVKRVFEESAKAGLLDYEWRNPEVSYTLGEEQITYETHSADLIICPKASDETPDPWNDFAEIAIVQSGRPILILPPKVPEARVGSHVVIAWNNTRESARAVFDALDLLREASSVRAITLIDNEDQRTSAQVAGANLIAALARHGIPATLAVSFASEDGAGETILSRLADEGCDLLITGGYSKSPLRETIFGGASHVILRDTWVPTLVSH